MASLARLLDAGRARIEVPDGVLAEARRRREQVVAALRDAFPGGRIYFNGSVAHGDAIAPLDDIDVGVVLPADLGAGYGPDADGPEELMEAARVALREHLKDDYPNLTVTVAGQRRAVLVRFGDPVTDGEPDFTCDVIVALPHLERGVYIPNTDTAAGWDQADPEQHTRVVLAAIDATDVVYARTVRLLKHWRDRHGDPLCSWNIKALALEAITEPMPLPQALHAFFDHAACDLDRRYTPDPAGVAGPVQPTFHRAHAVTRLRRARETMAAALEHEAAGRPASAQQKLHALLPDVVDAPAAAALYTEVSRLPGRHHRLPDPSVGAVTHWYGADPRWRIPFEATARRRFGTDLHAALHLEPARPAGERDGEAHLTYSLDDLEVDGHPPLVPVTVRFWARPGYDTYGHPPHDSPQVYAEPRLDSPHRYRDDALCLWAPFDPAQLRWTDNRGLLDLIEIIRRHLFLERYWRHTGGHRRGVWLLPDAPHGLPAA